MINQMITIQQPSLQPLDTILLCDLPVPMSNNDLKTPCKGRVSNQLYLNQQWFILLWPSCSWPMWHHSTSCMWVTSTCCPPPKKLIDAKLSCVPPASRRKTDWFRASMDHMVENDTRETHWELSPADSQKLLNLLFPWSLVPKGEGGVSWE